MNYLSDIRRILSSILVTSMALNKKTDRKVDILIFITAIANLILCILNIKNLKDERK